MFAIGCLLLVILPLAGLLVGLLIGNTAAAIWGAIIGFLLAAATGAVSVLALIRARRR